MVAFNIIRERRVHMSTVSLFCVNSSKLVTKDGCGHPFGVGRASLLVLLADQEAIKVCNCRKFGSFRFM